VADVRVYELAKEFGVESKAVLAELEKMGNFVRSASSFVEEPAVSRLRQHFTGNSSGAPGGRASPDRETLSDARRRPPAERLSGSPASAHPGESPDRDEPSLGLDGAAGVQVGSGNVQLNYFYGTPGRNGASSKSLVPGPGAAGSPSRGHAFISYVREDSGKVDVLQRMLQAAGIPVWRDTASLWPGEDWRAKIRGAITRDALVFIACFSCHSAARQRSYQNEELLLAIDQLRRRRPDDPWLIPVRFDDCDIPDLELGAGRTLASIQQADLFGVNRDLAARRLVEAVQRLLR
jgi:hypothetical protein